MDVPKVSSFTAVNVTDRSVVLTWTPAAGVSGYLLTWRHISGQADSDDVSNMMELWLLLVDGRQLSIFSVVFSFRHQN